VSVVGDESPTLHECWRRRPPSWRRRKAPPTHAAHPYGARRLLRRGPRLGRRDLRWAAPQRQHPRHVDPGRASPHRDRDRPGGNATQDRALLDRCAGHWSRYGQRIVGAVSFATLTNRTHGARQLDPGPVGRGHVQSDIGQQRALSRDPAASRLSAAGFLTQAGSGVATRSRGRCSTAPRERTTAR